MLQILFNFFIGAALASHAGVIYDRYNLEDFAFTRSKCASCKMPLSLLDEIPIISFLLLKGKCRNCNQEIPPHLFIIEFIGGLSFIDLNFNVPSIFEFLFRFFLLIIAIFDYYEKEFPTIFLIPLVIISFGQFDAQLLYNLVLLLPLAIIMFIFAIKGKMGFGDLYLYLILSIHYGSMSSNIAFLVASILSIIVYLLEKQNDSIPFIPYIYVGVLFANLL